MTTMISQKSMGRHIIRTHNSVIHNIQEHYIKDPLIEMKVLQMEGISHMIFLNGSLISSNVAYHDLICIQD